MSGMHKVVAAIVLTFFLGTMFFSLFHLSVGMDMSGGMSDCLFMIHEETVCPMNLTDHIGAWKSVFLFAVPGLTVLLAVVGLAVLVASVAPNLLCKIQYAPPPLCSWLQKRRYIFSCRPLQELFSSGILHPKLF